MRKKSITACRHPISMPMYKIYFYTSFDTINSWMLCSLSRSKLVACYPCFCDRTSGKSLENVLVLDFPVSLHVVVIIALRSFVVVVAIGSV